MKNSLNCDMTLMTVLDFSRMTFVNSTDIFFAKRLDKNINMRYTDKWIIDNQIIKGEVLCQHLIKV